MHPKTITGIAILSMGMALAGCGKKPYVAPPMTVQEQAEQELYMVEKGMDLNDYESAAASLAKLDGMKANLPAEYGPKIEKARQRFTAAKAKKI